MANGDSISSDMNDARTSRVRKLIEDGNYAQCPVAGEKDVQLFFIDGMAAILKQARQGNLYAILSGGTMGAVVFGLVEALKLFGGH